MIAILFIILSMIPFSASSSSPSPLSCLSYDNNEAQCMQVHQVSSPSSSSSLLNCFYSLSDHVCIETPLLCEERVGSSLCNRGKPIKCFWNETSHQCETKNWTLCDASSTTRPPFQCPDNCMFVWEIASCVSLLSSSSSSSSTDTHNHRFNNDDTNLELSWSYWCGYNPLHPLQWGLITREQCAEWKSPWCSFRNSTGMCMPNRVPSSSQRHSLSVMDRWYLSNHTTNGTISTTTTTTTMHYYYGRGDDNDDDRGNEGAYSVFDAMMVIVCFFVLFLCLGICADATMNDDHYLFYEREYDHEQMKRRERNRMATYHRHLKETN